ncbi:hypothetical protein MPSEU_000834800 [Mayamaea pseudoterrestris]|nr:hypothetical protein MPSEU_000834800 [Mayamaea pseudoterrestris]
MFRRTLQILVAVSLLVLPSCAQFGIAGKKKKTQFQQEQEKQQMQQQDSILGAAGVGDLASMQEQWAKALGDPSAMKGLEDQMGVSLTQAMELLAQMSPEELQGQMEEAFKMISGGEIVEQVVGKRDEILATLEASGAVPPEELAKFKADPEYFELKMRESFDQMGDILGNKDYLEAVQGIFGQTQELLKDPSKLTEMMGGVMGTLKDQLDSDEKIEEARLEILKSDMMGMFDSPEMKDILYDSKKWRDTVKEGSSALLDGLAMNDEL